MINADKLQKRKKVKKGKIYPSKAEISWISDNDCPALRELIYFEPLARFDHFFLP
jgi:hypothetical protein